MKTSLSSSEIFYHEIKLKQKREILRVFFKKKELKECFDVATNFPNHSHSFQDAFSDAPKEFQKTREKSTKNQTA